MKKKHKNKRVTEETQETQKHIIAHKDKTVFTGETETEETHLPDISVKETDLSSKEVIIFFSTITGLFLLAFCLKYIFPNVPEYIFERLLLLVLAAFCGYTLWKISPEIREFAYKHFPYIKNNKTYGESRSIKTQDVISEENNAESINDKN